MMDFVSQEELAKTFLNNWPLSLFTYTMPHYMMPLPAQVRKALIHTAECVFDGKDSEPWTGPILESFQKALNGPLQRFTTVFPKLGSRSPKDSGESLMCSTPEQIMVCLLNSERVWEDLQDDEATGRPSYLYLRKWETIATKDEFRCFVKNKKLVGISQYFYNEHFPVLFGDVKGKRNLTRHFLDNVIIPQLHLDSVVVDVYFQNNITVKLLELNPFDSRTDPCLFKWEEDFDETFRIIGPDGAPAHFECFE